MRTLLLCRWPARPERLLTADAHPDPNRAWVDLDTQPDADLAAVEVDDKSWDRTRYFEVDPGTRELTVRYQFTVAPTNIGPVDSPLWRDCQLNLKFGLQRRPALPPGGRAHRLPSLGEALRPGQQGTGARPRGRCAKV